MSDNSRVRGRATRDDVARLAGVSSAVVSYVVNDGPRPVSERTRQRVLDAIAALDYRPNASARAMKIGRTDTYGLVVSEVTNTYHAQMVQSVESHSLASGRSVFLAHSHRKPDLEQEILRNMAKRGVEGIIAMLVSFTDAYAAIRGIEIPLILLDQAVPLNGYTTISSDYEYGGRIATEHLLGHGYRDILAVSGRLAAENPNGRLVGYQNAMISAGQLPRHPIYTSWSREGGYDVGRALLIKGEPLPEAIFCFSDMIAIGLLRALQEAGVSVPEDVALIAFDGTISAAYTWPGLTTVQQPIDEMAIAAVEGLVNPSPPGHTAFPVNLVVRSSCGCPQQ